MEIKLSKFAGFCEGVRRAYQMVMDLDMEKAAKPVCILGTLAHNRDVNLKVGDRGIRMIERERFFESGPGEIGTLIITAHGTGPDVYEHAKKIGVEIVDATCPKVIRVQRLAKAFRERNAKVFLVGDKEHKEVRGIDDWSGGRSVIISDERDFEKIRLEENEKAVLLSQTTQNEEFFAQVAGFAGKKHPGIEVISTICTTTHERQEEIRRLASASDVVIIIGSPTSANSNRLYEIASELNPRSYFIENFEGLDENWFQGVKTAVVSAGASTPDWVIEKVIKRMTSI